MIYPTIAAFRSLVVYNDATEKYEWKDGLDPISVWDKCKGSLTSQIMSFASAIGDNPNTVGKDSDIWNLAYIRVKINEFYIKNNTKIHEKILFSALEYTKRL